MDTGIWFLKKPGAYRAHEAASVTGTSNTRVKLMALCAFT